MPAYDAVVVGAGPAGSTTAYHLSRAGARVLVVDKARFPRDKPCGGGVTVRAFLQAPVDLTPVVEQFVQTVRFSYRLGRPFDYRHPRTLVYMTQRQRLDAYLMERATAAGAVFRDGCAVRDIDVSTKDGVSLVAGDERIDAKVLIGADGANGSVAAAVGIAPVTDPQVAIEANCLYEGDDAPPEWRGMLALELGSLAGGYGWSFPKADHFNIGCGGWRQEGPHLRSHLDALIDHYDAESLRVAKVHGHHLPTRTDGAPIVRGRALLVGDAAGLVDPMSGEGIHSAFVSGRLAATAICSLLSGRSSDLTPYEAAVERELMADIRAAEVLRDAYHYSSRPCYFALQHSTLLKRSLCQIISGERTYTGFLKQLGPLQAMLRYWANRGRNARQRALAAV